MRVAADMDQAALVQAGRERALDRHAQPLATIGDDQQRGAKPAVFQVLQQRPPGIGRLGRPELMTEAELADYCRVSIRTAQRWRTEGRGPPVLWAGNKPRYRKSEVDAWLRRRAER
jgi:hypothetical protein